MPDQLWMFVLAQLVTAGGIYAAIRADLREHQVRLAEHDRRIERLEGRA